MIWILLTAAATAGLVAADRAGNKAMMRICKPIASAGFVGFALSGHALDNPYGMAIAAGLVLSFVGDLCLLSARARWFLGGLVSFLLAHVAYIVAFTRFDPTLGQLLLYAGLFAVPTLVVHRWLIPHVERSMRVPVRAYMLVITAMLASAAAALVAGAPLRVLIGATLFYASDLAVARERFVSPGFENRVWGLPTYYAAQLILASSV